MAKKRSVKKKASTKSAKPAKSSGKANAKSAAKPVRVVKVKVTKGKPRIDIGGLSGFTIVDSTQPSSSTRVTRDVARTPSLRNVAAKFGLDQSMIEGETGATERHGRIVQEPQRKGNLDPASDFGQKAIYLNPEGQVEFRQG